MGAGHERVKLAQPEPSGSPPSIPIGRIGNTSRADLSRTTVGFFSPSIKWRPTSKLAGVTRASQRLDKYGVNTGTEISHRRSPLCLAYSRIMPP